MSAQQVTVYGTGWCPDTIAARQSLKNLGVPFKYVDIERDDAGNSWVLKQNNGKRKMPTVDVSGKVLSIPDEAELQTALIEKGLLADA